MLETQLAQFAATILSFKKGRIPGKPEATTETANLIIISYDYSLNGWGFLIKKGDLGIPIISSSIGPCAFNNAICDLGSSVNIMSKEMYEELFYSPVALNSAYVQQVDQSTPYIQGLTTNLLVKIRNNYVPTDFMIVDDN